jgi:glycerol-3-phosphate O-acyltransferase
MALGTDRLPQVVAPDQGRWPPPPGDPLVLLANGATQVERSMIKRFAERLGAGGTLPTVVSDGGSATEVARARDAAITPVRVVWLPAERNGERRHGLRELSIAAGPSLLRARSQRRVLDRTPERCRLLVGEPAKLQELEARWAERIGTNGADDRSAFAAFVDRQADITLERAERRLTGERYRTPRRVVEELASDAGFVAGAELLAAHLGREADGVVADARAYLEEMATEQQRLARDLWTQWSRFMYSRGYELSVDQAALEELRELSTSHPLVFLPSHRSNLDGYVMASLLHEHGFPPNHTLGGINMAFWPLGPIGRRVGVIWIRRSFRDNEVYKYVLRRYLGYLVSKRFNLEWYIEGGRSRTGKLLPPRLGLFNYLADAVEELGIDDVRVVPVSIVYDELQEVGEMTTESRGRKKDPEGLPWLIQFARSQRGSFGKVHVNFGTPLVLADALTAHGSSADQPDATVRRLARSKAAFEVCTRINRATPVTPTSLVTLALLGVGDQALTLDEVRTALEPICDYVRRRELPGVEATETVGVPAGLEQTLATLVSHGVVQRFDDGPEVVHRIGADQELIAAFYRNATIHWFVGRAIVELALLRQADDDTGDPLQAALDDAFRLRDLFKFEFFFPEKAEFRTELGAEMSLIDPRWRERGPDWLSELGRALPSSGALMAHRVLRSFAEAYGIAADHLAACGSRAVDAEAVLPEILARGRQYRLQRRVHGSEAVSTHLFRSALKLAANRGLLAAADDVAARRGAFADELRDVLARLERVDELARDARTPQTLETA